MTQQPVLVRPQRAGVVGELVRQHRRDEAGHVGRERALGGAAVERACPAGTKYETSAMCTQARIPSRLAAERERVVEVLRRLRVDREGRQLAQVDAARRGSARGACTARTRRARPARRAAPRARSRSASRGPSARSTRARPRPGRTTARSPGCEVAEPLRVEHDRHAGREVRLADDQLAAAADLDDDTRLGGTIRHPARLRVRRAAPRLDPEEAAHRQPGAERAEARGPSRAGSAPSAGTRARARRGRSRARCAGSRAARSPCRGRGRSTASSGPAEPAEQALDHERTADEPVRRADELHHLDLTASREDREPDRVRDQQRRGDRAG